jgi:superfamily II DNA or RNA helicase
VIKLRDYQDDSLNKVARNFFAMPQFAAWRLLGVLPTGCGKTVIAAGLPNQQAITEWLNKFPREHRKILFIAHRDELLTQTKAKMDAVHPGLTVDIEQADAYASPEADIIVASVQTLASRKGRRLGRFDKDQFRIVIVDEAHHSSADTYISVLQYFDLLPPDDFMPKTERMDVETALAWQRQRLEKWDSIAPRDRLLLGITATSRRGDGVGLEAVFQRIAFQESMRDMIVKGWLARPRGLRVVSTTNIDDIKTRAGDLDQGELAKRINNKERNRLIVKAWLEHTKGKKTIAFTADVAQAHDLAQEATENGIRAVAIDGSMNRNDRREILRQYSAGKIDWLCNCNILTEGFDAPDIECVIMARPTKSELLYVQMAGRGVRTHPNDPVGPDRLMFKGKLIKQDCLILDIVDVTSRHRLITSPTLLGLPTNYDPEGRDLLEVAEELEKVKEDNPLLDVDAISEAANGQALSLKDIQMHAQEIDLMEPFHSPEIVEHATMAWMKTQKETYEINYAGAVTGETVALQQNRLGQWEILLREFGEPRRIVKPTPDLHEAFHKAESWLRKNRATVADKLDRDAGWRKAKVSVAQLGMLKRLNVKVKTDTLRAGEASNLISLYKNRLEKKHKRAS